MTARLSRAVRQHWLLVLFLLAGVLLRLVVEIAYQPALLYIDSFRYLRDLGVFFPGNINPIGYEVLLLGPVLLVGDLGLVAIVQHLLGLGLALASYSLLLRYGCRRWLAALAVAPVLLDAYQLQIEHLIMSDLLFQVLLLLAIILLTWWGTPGPGVALLGGLVLGTSVLVRLVGLTLVVPAAVFVLLAAGLRPRDGWKRRLRSATALVAGFVFMLSSYAGYHMYWTGKPALGGATGSVVFGRTAMVADCERLELTPAQRVVCPPEPVAERKRKGIDHYIHWFRPEIDTDALPEGVSYSEAQHSLAFNVLRNQPVEVFGGVVRDFMKGFAPMRTRSPGDVPLARWQFQTEYPLYTPEWITLDWLEYYDDGGYSTNERAAGFLRAYQLGGGYTPGTVLGLALVLTVAAMLGVGRARRSGLRAVCLLSGGVGTAVLFTAAAMEFSWRYQLPALVLLPLAGAMGITAITGRRPDTTDSTTNR
ncbi:hypothetical protein SAMN04487905_10459 [Actinopolyspora xinjiangensis]|uniref:Dolichyl-phosphate-mannose-protein mannosyltransferase n=1 Tax=Actinopolyspora xinjiangensis TaxID=405564 RepID=A0A1H0SLY5_9ACTN|nr:hypothetical protein [Actinopolyspora xinjiangensis]SDP42744.1 hypothetical protein SAMN04487905_10459 [Actinopolyspora xinjiangensis]